MPKIGITQVAVFASPTINGSSTVNSSGISGIGNSRNLAVYATHSTGGGDVTIKAQLSLDGTNWYTPEQGEIVIENITNGQKRCGAVNVPVGAWVRFTATTNNATAVNNLVATLAHQ